MTSTGTYFSNRVVWITGASSGIGEALARELAQQGARLIVSARRQERLERLAADCTRSPAVHVLPMDQERIETLPDVARRAEELEGNIDVLVLNAGIGQNSRAMETPLELVERIHRINYLGTVALAQPVLERMLERNAGHVVVTSSVLGKFGIHLRSAYSAAKHALHGYFDSLRCEIRDSNVSITIVCPGFVRTEIEERALKADGTPLGPTDVGKDGMAADVFARKMAKAIVKKKREVYIGGPEIGGVYLKRFFPALVDRSVRNVNMG